MPATRIGLIGAGVIGRTHAATIAADDSLALAGIADPSPAGRDFAQSLGVAWHADPSAMFAAGGLDGVIVATPNDLHLPNALEAIARGLPVLVEKPIANTVAQGEELAAASEKTGVPVLVGHHRRHNPIIATARRLLHEGAIGELATASILYAMAKPPEYFNLAWRAKQGTGGPVLINLIHEIDLVRFLCGEIAGVQAFTSSARRGFSVEDCAAVTLRLVNGGLATIMLSDCAASPWSWDLAAQESPSYPPQPARVQTHFLCGTKGSLALPTLDLWSYQERPDWFTPIRREEIACDRDNPYALQLRHFSEVIAGKAAPLASARDGTETLRATLAVHEAAASGRAVELNRY